ncbi:hypothetical protein [Streptomyces sp. NPDC048191]|uniref:hypothetical protein n=1 Tax=Streptomyces sp. NPDC048191 TaxID=3155484 RepID=UPI0033E3DDBA
MSKRSLTWANAAEVYCEPLSAWKITPSTRRELARARTSQFTAADLKTLVQRGGRIAGPEPATPALPDGPQAPLVVEADRLGGRDGDVGLDGQRVKLTAQLAGQQVALRFDGQLMHPSPTAGW